MRERDKRALMLLGGALVVGGLLQFDFWLPSGSSGSVSDSALDALEQRLQLAQVQARQRPLTEAELQTAQKQLEARESRLLESADAALAQAEMRSLVGDRRPHDRCGLPAGGAYSGADSADDDRRCGSHEMTGAMR